jgi:hypothetical protein
VEGNKKMSRTKKSTELKKKRGRHKQTKTCLYASQGLAVAWTVLVCRRLEIRQTTEEYLCVGVTGRGHKRVRGTRDKVWQEETEVRERERERERDLMNLF